MTVKKEITEHLVGDYLEPEISPEAWWFGAEQAAKYQAIKPDGDWSDVAIEHESQLRNGLDIFGCTVVNTQNQIEKMEKFLFGVEKNYSDRFTYNAAEITPPGVNPEEVYESIRKKGMIEEKDLPWDETIKTLEQYSQPRPLPQNLLKKALEWKDKYIFRHRWLEKEPNGWIAAQTILDALKQSPVCVAVRAWAFDGTKYVRLSEIDTHWTLIEGVYENGDWKCDDSYPPFKKRLDKNFGFKMAKMIYLAENVYAKEQLSLLAKIVNLISQWLGLIKKDIDGLKSKNAQSIQENEVLIKTDLTTPPKEESKKPSRIKEWAKAIEICENAPKWRNNPGGIKNRQGQFLIFKTYEEGFDYLCDYLRRACEGRHPAYPKAGETTLNEFTQIYVGFHEYNYASKVAAMLKVDVNIKIKELL